LISRQVLSAPRSGPPGASSRLSTARAHSKKAMSLQAMRVEVHHRRPRNKAPEERLRAMGDHSDLEVQKMAWLHVPKTGTSFVNTLLTWACDLSDNTTLDASYENATTNTYVRGFLEHHRDVCPPSFNICGGHHAIGDGECNNWEDHKGHFVGMFRHPTERVISGYYARQNGSAAQYNLPEYAKATEGCTTKMLTGMECAEYTHGAVPEGLIAMNQSMVTDAISRIDDGFSFVGLQEEWGISVCLFHRMFGGSCHSREFVNTRPATDGQSRMLAKNQLKDWVDPYDGEVYQHVETRFWETVEKFNLSREICANDVCKDAANDFLEATGSSKLAQSD